ncbi:DUF1491 family protein [Gellertiella hungarica]|uniref:DUF1491 domain-containing protein n=1 Tax=Gellertiella hungarica TaxID=1572859 RepID=A0A7W6J8A2_9HYPH|nr:DUF1491 family protein [Gellertiella hungarica]MBB4065751.1 hypothetical protein [Gellertiella hungarica]
MRVTTEFFAAALTRRIFADGGFAAVERKGAPEAGALFLKERHRDGSVTLYGPAPQAVFEAGEAGDRRFEKRLSGAGPEDVDALVARELRFDPDLWLIEAETDDLTRYIAVDEGE